MISYGYVVANIINSKNESKSQPPYNSTRMLFRCGKYHKFKERKQITTSHLDNIQYDMLWQIS
jgi:hypothetical protein